jgi:acyl transferase domain-containing protein
MSDTAHRAIAIVGVGAVLPDAPDTAAFWENVKGGRYSINETPSDRWDTGLYWDPDPAAPDKTYSKIGGWVRDWEWNPRGWRLPIPPTVGDQMDLTQKWAIAATRQALIDFGYPDRPLDRDRTAVVLGNAMAGDKHYLTALRIFYPEFAVELERAGSFRGLQPELQKQILHDVREAVGRKMPMITEDTMPGELANVIAGRIANLFDFHGPNFVVDAACASAMAGITAAIEGLEEGDYDSVITGGVDANMSASTFVKFCKIGALSATGTRPYADGADGFVMGEGAAVFLLKRLRDAEEAGDRIYAVIRGLGGASDGRGKGITAPNPVGQKLAVERAWKNAGLDPATVSLIEGHGTSTKVGDVIETESLTAVFGAAGARRGTVPLGSVKSNIGHLKGAAGAAGILKATLALHHRVVPPSVGFARPNPNIDFANAPFHVPTELKPWDFVVDGVRRAGVSAFGFGGTNFHVVLEEYVPGRLRTNGRTQVGYVAAAAEGERSGRAEERKAAGAAEQKNGGGGNGSHKAPLRGALLIGGASDAEIAARLETVRAEAEAGRAPAPRPPAAADLAAPVRLAIDYGDAAELAARAARALKALAANNPGMWKALRPQGIFRGEGPAPRVAFLYTGQGSQYVNMLEGLRAADPIVADTFAEADRVMTPILGRPLSSFIFIDSDDPAAVTQLEHDLKQTEITQPAVLATDEALTRMLAAYGVEPDMVMGHSLGEYGALVASGAMHFADALRAVSARGHAMKEVALEDNGLMAAVFAPIEKVEEILAQVDDYVVPANINSRAQAVIGGTTSGVTKAMQRFAEAGYQAAPLPVSHAFHTRIVAPASEPLRRVLQELEIRPPSRPIVANVSGAFYPTHPGAEAEMVEILARQVASPVQFVRGLRTLYEAGARVFVETGPKKALHGFVEEVLGDDPSVLALFTNHPKIGDAASLNQALCGLYASGLGRGVGAEEHRSAGAEEERSGAAEAPAVAPVPTRRAAADATREEGAGGTVPEHHKGATMSETDRYLELGRLFADFLDRGRRVYEGEERNARSPDRTREVVVTGAALGLPGTERVFDDANIARLLRGEQFIDTIPRRLRAAMVDKHVTRLVKGDGGEPRFEVITDPTEVLKLAGRAGAMDLAAEFGFPADRLDAMESTTRLAIAAGIDALRDAGVPLAMRYKTTTRGTRIPERWMLPESLRDETGVIFASAFPGYDAFSEEMARCYQDSALRQRIAELQSLRERLPAEGGTGVAVEIDRRIRDLEAELESKAYVLDRKFLFRILSMGHSQFAEYIGARGPNTQVNSACASTTQAVALAEDWIRLGRCRRVVVVSADNVTSDHLLEWIGAGFLASGAAATDEVVEKAALPFDRRRHGMIPGMGAAALVVEGIEAVRERGIRPIAQVLGTVTANSAFHGTRLDVEHIRHVMERLVAQAERDWGIDRARIAPQTVFVSHETYTPARGGSAQAEIDALRHVFGAAADQIVIANTKGFTGHAMGAGVEDVLAVKALETGVVPPVANFREIDPELGALNLSKGGAYPVQYALRLGAGFGSQISMTLLCWVPTPSGVRPAPTALGFAGRIADEAAWTAWLRRVSGYAAPDIEVVQRTLRIRHQGAPQFEERTVPAVRPAEVPVVLASPAHATPTPWYDPAAHAPAAPASFVPAFDTAAAVPSAERSATQPQSPSAPAEAPVHAGTGSAKADVVPSSQPPQAPADATAPDPVETRVLELVAQQTGYPIDMLDLDLDLEADLGVDTVKQAEMFVAVRGEWAIERDENLKLRDFPTLRHVIGFVHTRRPDLAPAAVPSAATTAQGTPAGAEQLDSPPSGADPVQQRVLELVADQTGYPIDMLELDLDMEADLGVDTVKQAEMFVRVRQEWSIPRDENLKLRDFPTLRDVIGFVYARAEGLRPLALEVEVPATPAAAAPVKVFGVTGEQVDARAVEAKIRASLKEAAAVPRRVAVPVLRPALELCKPTGVVLQAGSRVVVMLDRGGVGEALVARLEKRGVEVLAIADEPDTEVLAERLGAFAAAAPVTGVYWLPSLDEEGPIDRMELTAWREALRVRVKLLYTTARTLYEQLAEPGRFLVAATRLGGLHGYDAAGAVAPMGGAVTGFVKTLKRERTDALVKAVDFAPSRKTARLAELLIEETLHDPGVVEVGHRDERRWSVGLDVQPLAETDEGMRLDRDSVFVVTGAAGSIVSAIVQDLAAVSGGTFYLLDLVPEPDPRDPDLLRFGTDRDGLKRDIFERLKAAGERATPATVERELARLERAHAALSAIAAVRDAGGTPYYHSVNLLDAEGITRTIERVRERHGRIDVLLHAGGLEISRFLPDKSPAEFDLVFDVKSDGWFNLLHAIGDMPLRATVCFSSVAGRFGNGGQADYSAANDLLCKFTSHFRTSRPGTRALALDWTAWGGIGMATRGSIPKMMEMAGIDMLLPEAGIPWIRRELTAGRWDGEMVVGQRLGILVQEWDESGGLDVDAVPQAEDGPAGGRISGFPLHAGLTVETTLDPKAQPFLDDHRIDGTPVLPGVMGLELFAQAATRLLPELGVSAVEEVEFLAPFKFYRDEPRVVTVRAVFLPDDDGLVAQCLLVGRRELPTGTEETVHFRARLRLGEPPAGETADVPVDAATLGVPVVADEDIYRVFFHGPAYRVLEKVWEDGTEVVGLMRDGLPANHHPVEQDSRIAPRLIELCFQAAGIREIGATGRMGLPQRIARVRRLRGEASANGNRLMAVVGPTPDGGFDARVVDTSGAVYVQMEGYHTVALPGAVAEDALRPLQAVMR